MRASIYYRAAALEEPFTPWGDMGYAALGANKTARGRFWRGRKSNS